MVAAGQPFSGAARTNSPVTVTIGGVSAPIAFAGIPEAGLYQLNLTVPANTGSGDQALRATVNGVQTPPGPVVTVREELPRRNRSGDRVTEQRARRQFPRKRGYRKVAFGGRPGSRGRGAFGPGGQF